MFQEMLNNIIMPLKKGKSKKIISKNIETEMDKYKKTGKMGKGSKPKSKKAAVKQAAAIAYSKAGKGKKVNESAKLAKKDYDKYGKVETPEQEYKGSKDKAIKKAKSLKESFDSLVKNVLKRIFIS